ncbi:DDE_Tnp_IS1595 domain-containing protein [Trichonephila clavata]|uniref:DDE_Tnp_IS1595 domain-containing protein n=1 Tax=Trichonephila clavata TaxID=2740835 RepID=A0A8X6JM99_TRICU|nr:DDE_Tnp_IS1595 domain-containing protein [Trichonephila clavata]
MASINSVVSKYQEILTPKLSFSFSSGKRTLGREGIPNRLFCIVLCQNKNLFVDFLKEAGLILSKVLCEKCNVPMTFTTKNSSSDGFCWVCRNRCNKICGRTKTIRIFSWFHFSKLKMEEIFLLTYEYVRGTDTKKIAMEYDFSSSTLCIWWMLVAKIIFDYIKQTSQKIERETKKLALVAIPNGTEEIIIKTVKEWIEPGTSVCLGLKIKDVWLGEEACELLRVEYKISFIDSERKDTNSILCIWGRVKSLLSDLSPRIDIKLGLAKYLFEKSCKEKGVDFFIQFLEIIRNINWKQRPPLHMPQEFQILRCYACEKFQVHHVKKSKNWQCKVCGEKQSLKKAFFIGSSRDCRLHVQQWNFKSGQQKMDNEFEQSNHNQDNACLEDCSFGELFKGEDFDSSNIGDFPEENIEISENAFDDDSPNKKQRCESYLESNIGENTNPLSFLLSCNELQDQEEIVETVAILKDSKDENSTDPFDETSKESDSLTDNPGISSKLNCINSRAETTQNRGFQLILSEARKRRKKSLS